MKDPNQNFQKSVRVLWFFGAWKSRSEAPKSIFLQMVDSQEPKKFSRIAMALIVFQRKLTIWIFQICRNWNPKWSPWATILYWLKKVQLQFCSNFEGIFGCRTSGAPKKAPFMYVEICPWVILFNSKLENEVLDDFQTYRLEKHGFFRFQGSPTRYGEFWGLQFGLQSPKNFIFINFRKNWKFFNFIMYTQNAPVLTCNPKFRNAIRFLTME